MDDLTENLARKFEVSRSDNLSSDRQHPRSDLFKIKGEYNSQNARRKQFLERQKSKRCDAHLLARKIAEDNLSDIDDNTSEIEDASEDQFESPFTTSGLCSYSSKPRKQHKTPRLMLSEWLVDVPENFSSSCYIVPCPVGKRNLVTSSQGYTTAATKFGVAVQYQFPSMLPNGNRTISSSRSTLRYQKTAYTILDCVYSPPENKYYCLDLLCWNGHPFLDCETEFRFFWLHTKFQEHPEITKKTKFNKAPFEVLPFFPCTTEGILQAVTYFSPEKLDGLWFFHKETHYHLGVTPLVGWLKPHMLPSVLNVNVPPEYSEPIPRKPPKKSPSKVDSPTSKYPDYNHVGVKEKLWAMPIKTTDSSDQMENMCLDKGSQPEDVDFDELLNKAAAESNSAKDFSSDW